MTPPRHAPFALFAFWVALYTLAAAGRIAPGDEETMFRVTESLATRGWFDISRETAQVDPLAGAPGLLPDAPWRFETTFATPGADGRLYAWYGPAQSFVAVPLYLAGRVLAVMIPSLDTTYATRLSASWLAVLATALAGWLVADAGLALGYRLRTALALSAAYGLATTAWPLGKTWYSEPAVTALVLLAFDAAVRAGTSEPSSFGDMRAAWLSGVAFAAAALFRATAVILAPALAVLAVWGSPRAWRPRSARLLALVVPVAAAVVLLGAYNAARFGSPLAFGYRPEDSVVWDSPVAVGLIGMLATPGKGLFLYNPPLLLGLGGLLLWFARGPRAVAAAVALGWLVTLAFFAPYHYWTGGWNWGLRFVLPVIPLLLLPAGALLESATTRAVRWVWMALCILGVFANLPAVLADHSRNLIAAAEQDPEFYNRAIWDPAYSPIARQWPMVGEVWALWTDQRSNLVRGAQRYPADVPGVVIREEFLRWNAPDFWQLHWSLLGLPLGLPIAVSVLCPAVMAWAGLRLRAEGRRSQEAG